MQLGETPHTWLARRERLKATHQNGNGCGTPLAMAVQLPDPAPDVSQLSMFSAADFPASPTALLVAVLPPQTTATSGPSSADSFASLNPDGSWRKTCQGYSQAMLDGSLETFSGTWPRAGMTRSGTAFLRQPLVPLTDATASGSWPTPQAKDSLQGFNRTARTTPEQTSKAGWNLHEAAMYWPTPCAEDAKNVPYQKGKSGQRYPMLLGAVNPQRIWTSPTARDRHTVAKCMRGRRSFESGNEVVTPLPVQVGGTLNPTWVEWLMGYPLGWTVCADSATPSSRRSRNGSRGGSSRQKA